MQSRHTTIMILVPGRSALSLDLSSVLALKAAVLLLALPLGVGAGLQRCWGFTRTTLPPLAMASLVRAASSEPRANLPGSPRSTPTGTLLATVRPAAHSDARAAMALPPRAAGSEPVISPVRAAGMGGGANALSALEGPAVLSVKAILRAISASRRRVPKDVDPASLPINGVLRLQSLHLGETLSARPFDDLMRPDPRAFADINHLMRCRVTGHEIDMDPQLVGILAQLSTLYGRTLQLVSGHRAPHARGTRPTSQHTLGRAADIRVQGVGIEELKKAAIRLGARGVGLYPEKGFVHIDVRQKTRYFWTYTARGGELGDNGTHRPPASDHAEQAVEDEDSVSVVALPSVLPPEPGGEADSPVDEPASEPSFEDAAE